MELGSAEHKQLLTRSIVKVAVKTASLGFILGFILMIPNFIRDNAFSSGLLYLGTAIILGSLLYAFTIAYKKYQRIVKPFEIND